MPNSLTITVEGVPALIARLGRAVAVQTLVPPITRGVNEIRATLATYPPQSGRPNPPKSDKQRRYLMMLGRLGLIPYRRTGNLGRSWVEDIQTSSTGVVGTVGNSVASPTGFHYGPLVQGGDTQTTYHAGTWGTDQQAFDKHRQGILDDIGDAINSALG